MNQRFVRILLIALFSHSFMSAATAEIYRWVDDQGRIHFSDQPPLTQKSETIELPEITTYQGVSVADMGGAVVNEKSASKLKLNNKKVVMYSAEWCGVCTKAKKYFRKKKIPFTEYDIDKSKKARKDFKKMKATGVPVILVGKKRMNGFNAKKFEKLYGQI